MYRLIVWLSLYIGTTQIGYAASVEEVYAHLNRIESKFNPKEKTASAQKLVDTFKPIVNSLREKFSAFKTEYRKKMVEGLFVDGNLHPGLKSSLDFNRLIQRVCREPIIVDLFSAYQTAYLNQAGIFPGLVLVSKKMKGIVEGNLFEIERDDFLLAIEDLKKKIQPSSMKNWIQVEWKERGFHEIHTPEINEDQFKLIQRFHSNDLTTVQFLIDGFYMKAIWRLRNLGFMKEAEGVETWLNQIATRDDKVEKIGSLGGGTTITKLVQYPFEIKGVYKTPPKSSDPYQGFVEWWSSKVSKFEHEIAAYRVDRLLNLNYVPLTKKVKLENGVGSLQYFVEPATQARFMNQAKNPKSSSRWVKHRGRALEDGNIRLFDWIISNADRNIDNYLIQDDGQVVLIDHAFSFFYKTKYAPTSFAFEHMIPSRRVFEALSFCDSNPTIVEQELKGYVTSRDIGVVKQRIHYAYTTLQHLIKKRGADTVFEKADALDKRLGIYRPDLL